MRSRLKRDQSNRSGVIKKRRLRHIKKNSWECITGVKHIPHTQEALDSIPTPDTHSQEERKGNRRKTQEGKSHLQDKRGGLPKHQHCWHLSFGPPASRAVRI